MTDELVFYTNAAVSCAGCLRRSAILIAPSCSFWHDDEGAQLSLHQSDGKVPTIRHGDTVVTEVAAICAYLADAFPRAGLAPPPGDRLRGPYYRWLFFAAGPVEAAVTNKALDFVVSEGRERMAGYGSFADAMKVGFPGGTCSHIFYVSCSFCGAGVLLMAPCARAKPPKSASHPAARSVQIKQLSHIGFRAQ